MLGWYLSWVVPALLSITSTDSVGTLLMYMPRMLFYTDPIGKGGFLRLGLVFYWLGGVYLRHSNEYLLARIS